MNVKQLLSFLFLPFLIFGSCRAKEKSAGDHSLLWRVTGKDGGKPSYLFGTIHLLCPDDYLWTPAMSTALKACSEVCFEMDMDDPKVLAAAAEGMADTDGKLLKDYFTTGQYRKLNAFTQKELGMNLDGLQQMKPVMLQMLFTTKAVNCTIPVSYEANIMEEAKRQGKKISGLEQPEEQIAVLNTLKDDSAALQLLQMADSFSTTRKDYQSMLRAYKNQDLPALYQQIHASGALGDDMGTFLDDRNVKWIPRIKASAKNKSVFFAVGAGHLWGPQGVIALLRSAGYTVRPVL